MKIITSIIFTIYLLTTSFSALANEEEGATNTQGSSNTLSGCSPVPECQIEQTITFEQWVDRLTMQQLMELLQQEQPLENTETNNE